MPSVVLGTPHHQPDRPALRCLRFSGLSLDFLKPMRDGLYRLIGYGSVDLRSFHHRLESGSLSTDFRHGPLAAGFEPLSFSSLNHVHFLSSLRGSSARPSLPPARVDGVGEADILEVRISVDRILDAEVVPRGCDAAVPLIRDA